MMMLPDGWIVDTPGVSAGDGKRLAGNAVVPRQGAVALRYLLAAASRGAA